MDIVYNIQQIKVLYKQTINEEGYVYIITSDILTSAQMPTITGMTKSTCYGLDTIYWNTVPSIPEDTSIAKTYFMANWNNGIYNTNNNAKCVSKLLNIANWNCFVNSNYSEYIIGAIGTPTLEMFIASINEKENSSVRLASSGTTGYTIDGSDISGVLGNDALYFCGSHWLASPSSYSSLTINFVNSNNCVSRNNYGANGYENASYSIRPVVCLKANTPVYFDINNDITVGI